MQLTVGDVIRWKRYPYPKSGEIKARWFIYLGRTAAFSTPVFAYLCTTTTQASTFDQGGERSNHACRRFNKRQFPVFERDCILDFDEEIHTVTQGSSKTAREQIIIEDRLDVETMRNIYKQFSRPGVLSKVVLQDIHDSFNRDGITGLKKPK